MTCKIKQGDCLELMNEIPDKSIDLVCTDIPYGEVSRVSNGLRDLDKGKADIETFDINIFLDQLVRLTKGSIYIFCGTEQVSTIRKQMVDAGMSTRLIIWKKTNPSPMNGDYIWLSGIECCVYGKFKGAVFNGHCENTVLEYPCGRNKLHPTQKPTKLLESLILHSSKEGDIVFDPCMGSGSTGVACINTGRNFIGYELDNTYFEIAQNRINDTMSV